MQYSVVNYKTVKENSDFRIDGEYYHPAILSRLDLLEGKNNDFLYNLVKFIVGPFGSTITVDKYVDESDYRYIRNKDINDFVISDDDPALIPENVYGPLKQFHIQKEDLLLTVVGTLGKVAIAQEKDNKSIFSCKSTLLKSRKVNPYYLLTYLNSPTGQIFSLRGKRGAIQEGLNLTDLKDIKVFIPSTNFQKYIENLIKKSFGLLDNSKSLYSQAEQLLLSELGLLNWKPKRALAFVKKFSDTQKAERFDAEYFLPNYEEIVESVKRYKGGFDIIKEQFKPNKKSFKKILDKEYQYVEIGCVNISDGSTEPILMRGADLPANAKIKLQKNDVIVSKVRPYRGAIGIVGSENYVGSGAFTILQENGAVNKETLFVFLRLKPLLDFSLKFNTGTSYPTITDEDVLNFPLPKIDSKTQEEIRKKIAEMYETKKLSKSLLEIAKRGIEIAIEKDEQVAEDWINQQLSIYNIVL